MPFFLTYLGLEIFIIIPLPLSFKIIIIVISDTLEFLSKLSLLCPVGICQCYFSYFVQAEEYILQLRQEWS